MRDLKPVLELYWDVAGCSWVPVGGKDAFFSCSHMAVDHVTTLCVHVSVVAVQGRKLTHPPEDRKPERTLTIEDGSTSALNGASAVVVVAFMPVLHRLVQKRAPLYGF